MAITITQEPEAYTPSDNPIYFAFSSDQTGQPNFSFIVKVFVNGTQVSEHQVYPTNGTEAYYNAVNEGMNYTTIPDISNASLFSSAENYAELYIEIFERYGTSQTTKLIKATSSTIIVWKAKIDTYEFQNYVASDIFNKFITNHNLPLINEGVAISRLVRLDENLKVMVCNQRSDFTMTLRTYTGINTATGVYVDTHVTTDEFTIINLSPDVLTPLLAPIATCDYFTVALTGSVDLAFMRVVINKDCKQTNAKRIHWIGQLGSPEAFSFDLVSRTSNDYESFGYKRSYNYNPFTYNYQGRNIDTIKRKTKKLKCESNWLNNDEHEYIVDDLYFSPIVYIENGDEYDRVKITNTSSEQKFIENDMVFNETIELMLGTDTSFLA